jgi:methyltransferase
VGSGDRTDNAVRMEEAIHGYIAACNTGDAEAIAAFFAPGAVHLFPAGLWRPCPRRTGDRQTFARLVQASASRWSIDQILCDPGGNRAVAEWTVRRTGLLLRDDEWYESDPATGLITEIRGYLASPPASGASRLELQGFPYADRGYTMDT